jgi:hypothetical protein
MEYLLPVRMVSLTSTNLFKRVHRLVANYTLVLRSNKHARESAACLGLHFCSISVTTLILSICFNHTKRHALQGLNTLCPFDFSDLADLVTPEMIQSCFQILEMLKANPDNKHI